MKKVIFALFILINSLASAKTYYVAPATATPPGNDSNPGTKAAPWLRWRKAATTATQGDTVYFRGGVYYYTTYLDMGGTMNSGVEGDPICFFNYPGEVPIFDMSGATMASYVYPIATQYCSWIEIDSMMLRHVVMANSSTIIVGFYTYKASHIKITNCKAFHIQGTGFGVLGGSDEILYKNCDAWMLCDSLAAVMPGQDGVGFQWNTMPTVWGNLVDPAYSSHIYFDGCRTWDFSDNGFAGPGVGYVEIKNCWAFAGGKMYGGGCGFKMSNTVNADTLNPLSRNVHNCISAINKSYGFSPNNNGGHAFNGHLYNNFFYHNGYKGVAESLGGGCGLLTYNYLGDINPPNEMYLNNISYDNEYHEVRVMDNRQENYTHEYNSWDHPEGVTITDDDFLSLDTLQLWWPRQVDGSLPDITFGKLKPGSDLIDAGQDSIVTRDHKIPLTYYGNAPDLGWFESSSGITTPVAPVYISSAIENATPSRLEINYNLSLANIVPSVTAFMIRVNSGTRNVSSVEVSENKVILILSNPVVFDDMVTVAYTMPAINPIQTSSGGKAASFSTRNVTNNCRLRENMPPVANLLSPGKNNSFIAPATITIDVTANDPDGYITKVEFFNGSIKLAETTAAPYSFTWKDVPEGTYILSAKATDNKNLTTVSEETVIIVEKMTSAINQLPVIEIISPVKDYKYKKNDDIIIEAEAFDPDGSISLVEFKIGNSILAEISSPPFIFTWQNVDTGNYLLTATATDNQGAISNSFEMELVVEILKDLNSDIINLFPNPTDGPFTINLVNNYLKEGDLLTITSLNGNILFTEKILKEESPKQFDMTFLNSGIYVLTISNKHINYTKKFLKK